MFALTVDTMTANGLRLGDAAVFEKRPARNRSRIELLLMKIATKAQ
jgi:hypothetical protein